MGQTICNLFSGSNYGVVWNKSSKPIFYEIDGPWQEITEDTINNEVSPKFKKLPVGFEVDAGQFYKRGRVINHVLNKMVVEVAPGDISTQGLHKVEYGKTKISVRVSENENDYIIKNDVIKTEDSMRICVEDNRKHHPISKKKAKELIESNTQMAAIEQEYEPDETDQEFLKVLNLPAEHQKI